VVRLLAAILASQGTLPAQYFDRAAVRDASISADAQVVAFTLRSPSADVDRFDDTVFHLPADGGTPQPVGPGVAPAFSPIGTSLAWLSGQALVIRETLTGSDRNITGDQLRVMAFRWAPDGARIAFVAESIGLATSPAALYVVDAAGGAARRLSPEGFAIGPAAPELPGLIEFDWLGPTRLVVSGRAPDATDGPHAASLHVVDLASGTLRYLAGKGGRWHLPVVSPNGEWIAFTGQALGPAGWMASELIVLKPDGSGLRRLTVGRDLDALDLAWASDSRTIWFAVEERGNRNLLRVDSRNSRIGTGTSGNHLLALQGIARRGDWALAVRATATSPGALIRFPLGRPHEMMVLHEPAGAEFTGEIEELDLSVPGTGNMHGWLLRPPQFDASRRYPLLVEIHGGPHAMAGAGYAPFALAHAAAGWLVLRLNPRGSTGFGFDLSNALLDRWPGRDMDDLQAAVSALVERGLVDTTKIVLAGTGAGAAVAVALRAADSRVAATILRCADGDWLMGGTGIDRPLWSEWHAARPFPRLAAEWWQGFGALAGVPKRSPLLVIEGSGSSPHAATLSEMVHAAAGNASRFMRVPGSCREAGPTTQQRMFEVERGMLERLKD
jgi:dipeptidyl aminopeptidase/acylaminoacyl peptidase